MVLNRAFGLVDRKSLALRPTHELKDSLAQARSGFV
jgi:hypothetical protein